MNNQLSPEVQMQFMRPGQLEAAARAFPVVYVPFGLIEYPELVDKGELGEGPLNLDMKPPSGIGGLDPREHASAEVGARNVELAAAAIGRKAQELLESLPEEERSFGLGAIEPGQWWLV